MAAEKKSDISENEMKTKDEKHNIRVIKLTLSQTSPVFHVSAIQVF